MAARHEVSRGELGDGVEDALAAVGESDQRDAQIERAGLGADHSGDACADLVEEYEEVTGSTMAAGAATLGAPALPVCGPRLAAAVRARRRIGCDVDAVAAKTRDRRRMAVVHGIRGERAVAL